MAIETQPVTRQSEEVESQITARGLINRFLSGMGLEGIRNLNITILHKDPQKESKVVPINVTYQVIPPVKEKGPVTKILHITQGVINGNAVVDSHGKDEIGWGHINSPEHPEDLERAEKMDELLTRFFAHKDSHITSPRSEV